MKCKAPTKTGNPCRFEAGESGLCLQHDPERAEEWRAELRRRGQAGAARSAEVNRRPQRTECRLRSADDLLQLLERITLRVENSKAKPTELANAIAKMVVAAGELIKLSTVEKENAELKAFIEKHLPEARGALKAVP